MEKTTRAATTRDSEKYIVRFPDGMRDRIAEAAKAGNRSMNAEIVSRLQETFSDSKPLTDEVEKLRIELKRQEYLATRFEMVAENTDKVLAIAGRLLHETIEQFPAGDKTHLVDETMAKVIGTWVVPDSQGAVRDLLGLLERADEVKASLGEFLRRLEERDGLDSESYKPRNTKATKANVQNIGLAVAATPISAPIPAPAQDQPAPIKRPTPQERIAAAKKLNK